jgi:hypothetical protein
MSGITTTVEAARTLFTITNSAGATVSLSTYGAVSDLTHTPDHRLLRYRTGTARYLYDIVLAPHAIFEH